ncbi:tRNA pseudouridine(38-40) synthase TruA [soil metagenome]
MAELRLRLDLAYDGTDFSGWAVQPDRRTVQGVLEAALSTLFRVGAAAPIRLTVAGRTDAGVHASGQVAHCDVALESYQEQAAAGLRRLAGLLPPDVRVWAMSPAPAGFDARFSAVWRRYSYRLSDADAGVDPVRRRDTVGWRRTLDVEAMDAAAQHLLGLNDFVAFCRRREGATAIRTLQHLSVRRSGSLIDVSVRADAFCHSMVRSLVGALCAVGEGRRDIDWPASLLSRSSRSDEITVAPPHGLTLAEVGYPDDTELAARAVQSRAVRGPLTSP